MNRPENKHWILQYNYDIHEQIRIDQAWKVAMAFLRLLAGTTIPSHLKGRWCLHIEEAAKAHEEQNGPQGTCVGWCASQVEDRGSWHFRTCYLIPSNLFHWTLRWKKETDIRSLETIATLSIDIRLVHSDWWCRVFLGRGGRGDTSTTVASLYQCYIG